MPNDLANLVANRLRLLSYQELAYREAKLLPRRFCRHDSMNSLKTP